MGINGEDGWRRKRLVSDKPCTTRPTRNQYNAGAPSLRRGSPNSLPKAGCKVGAGIVAGGNAQMAATAVQREIWTEPAEMGDLDLPFR